MVALLIFWVASLYYNLDCKIKEAREMGLSSSCNALGDILHKFTCSFMGSPSNVPTPLVYWETVYEEENFPHVKIEKCKKLTKTLFFFPKPLQALHIYILVLYYFSVKDSLFGESRMEEILDEKEEDNAVPWRKSWTKGVILALICLRPLRSRLNLNEMI